MADIKISALAAIVATDATDAALVPIVSSHTGSAITYYMTVAELRKQLLESALTIPTASVELTAGNLTIAAGLLTVGTPGDDTGAGAGDILIPNNNALIAANAAGTNTVELIRLNATDKLVLGLLGVGASSPAGFSPNYYIEFVDRSGSTFYLPAMAGTW